MARILLHKVGLLALAACVCILPAAAQGYKVEKLTAPPPGDLAAAVRDTLSADAFRVSGPSSVLCEVWLRRSVPVLATPVKDSGVTFGQIAEGTLVGAVRFPSQVEDFRKRSIQPGVYTLRYALIPVDGNHAGVAQQRDFILIGPASSDSDPATLTRDQTLDLSRMASGSNHPSVWSLALVSEPAPAMFPVLVHQQGDGDLWLLEFQLTPATNVKPIPAALVVVGHSPEI